MTDELESALRVALRERAAEVPGASISRLTQLDYRPRRRGVTPPLAAGALSLAAGGAGAAALIVSLTAGASNAFAGWTAKPTPPAPGQLAAAYSDCQTHSPIDGLPLKLTDTRGPFTFSVYADSQSSATCIKGPSFTSVSGSMSSAPVSVPAGRIVLSSAHPRTDRSGQAYSFAQGRTGAGVSAVTLVLDDGTKVQSTVQNGWFVAWWPGAHEVKTADVTTSSGTSTQTFEVTRNPCGGQSRGDCASGESSDGAVGKNGRGAKVSGYAVSGSVAHAGSAPAGAACRGEDVNAGCPAK